MEDNRVNSFRSFGVLAGLTRDMKIQGNIITGGGTGASGILLGAEALKTGSVTRNAIAGNPVGLLFAAISSVQVDSFGAAISLNDFQGNQKAILLGGQPFNPATVSVDLSVDGRGNYWGHTCADDSANDLGFIEFGKPGADSPSANIFDSHPYGVPVAETPDALLPMTLLGGYCAATPE